MAHVQMRLRRKPLVQLILASLCTTSAPLAFAQATGDLGSVQSTATSSSTVSDTGKSSNPQSAPAQAPTQGSLTASEPKSVINHNYIENSTAPTSSYSDIMQIAPSVSGVTPNGPGLM